MACLQSENIPMLKRSAAGEPAYYALHIDELVIAAQEGAMRAFEEIVRRYRSRVYRTALKILRNGDDAEDAVQEVFLSVHKHLGGFRRDAAFGTWITRIAINMSLMQLRRIKRNQCVSFDALDSSEPTFSEDFKSSEPSAEQILIDHQRQWILASAISKLPMGLRDVTADRLNMDISVGEIARRRGISLPAAKSRLLRAKHAIAEQIQVSSQLRG